MRNVCSLLYGTGMRLLEGLRLRVKDIDFGQHQITIRDGKGGKDRVTMLPASLEPALRSHLRSTKALHAQDLAAGYGRVYLPNALDKKYPTAAAEWGWQYVFPAPARSLDPRLWRHAAAPPEREAAPENLSRRRSQVAARQACDRPYAEALLCHPPPDERL